MATNDMRKIGSAERVFDILEVLRNHDGVTASTVAEEIDAAVSTTHQYLQTIEDCGFIVRKSNEYHLSLRFLDYGAYARNHQRARQLAEEKVQELSEETGERAQYVVPEGDTGVVICTAADKRAVKTGVTLGMYVPFHATAAGKAILAYLPEEEIFDIIENTELEQLTEHTITDPDRLLEELKTIREENVAYNDQEQMNRLRAVGVPVRDADDEIIGALSVSAPSNRFRGEVYTEEIPNLLLGTANELELNIEYNE